MDTTFEAVRWPEEMAPSRSPIHFTNELEVEASAETIWSRSSIPKRGPASTRASNTFSSSTDMNLCALVEV